MKPSFPRVILLSAACMSAWPIAASAETPVKVVMDWAWEGPQANWAAAGQSKCFPQRDLKVTIDRGYGSGDSIGKVASGAYDIGVADFASIVAYNAQHPENKLMAVYIISDLSPTSVTVLKSSGIKAPKDLEGKRIADSQGEASRVLFPAFAKKTGIDPNKITWINVTPNLRQTTLLQGQADAAAGHMFTVQQGLKALKVNPEDIYQMTYAAYGVELPGNAVMAKPAYLAAHKKEVTDVLSCLTAGVKATVSDPKTTIANLKVYNPLIDEDIETGNLDFAVTRVIKTPYAMKNGLSQVDPARMDAALAMIADAISIPKPTVADIWSGDYLPPQSERMLPTK